MERKCLRKSCSVLFEPNKPKQLFCSAKCRVYHARDKTKAIAEMALVEEKRKHAASSGINVSDVINSDNTDAPSFKNEIEKMIWEGKQKILNNKK